LAQRYTQKEVSRILGLDRRQLRYWERLDLVHPRAKWGERFYSFADLVALRNIKSVTDKKIPARRLQRAVTLIEEQFGPLGAVPLGVQELRLVDHGSEILVIPPGYARPFNPIKKQWAFSFSPETEAPKLHTMAGRTPEQLFEMALHYETREETMPQAVDVYRQVLNVAPKWIDARINLGVALYQMGNLEDARVEFASAAELDPQNGIARYNLGCVLEEEGEMEEAIGHLLVAECEMPTHADVHFNLALAYDKTEQKELAREQWTLYLKYAPNGHWANQARERLKEFSPRKKKSPPIPFRRSR
jgi:tetratricopeptide (TPR) repeat protein